ncbi:MAG: hypothetical protein K2Q06_03900, partial [Parvularculaceae bacterium]|nr:hypothetical protein [Parvularculaceae bacterium]
YSMATEGWMIYVLIPFGALAGFAAPSLQGIMSKTIPPDAQGELQGAIGALQGLSMIIGPYVMTQVFAAFLEPGVPISVGGVTLFPAGAPFYFPGAPFALAGLLGLVSLSILTAAFRAERRAAQAARVRA